MQDNPSKYYITVITNEEGREELIEDPQPLKSIQRWDHRRVHLFLRYSDMDPESTEVRVYGGWLR